MRKEKLKYLAIFMNYTHAFRELLHTRDQIFSNLFSARSRLSDIAQQRAIDELISHTTYVFGELIYQVPDLKEMSEIAYDFIKDDLDRAVVISKNISSSPGDTTQYIELRRKVNEISIAYGSI